MAATRVASNEFLLRPVITLLQWHSKFNLPKKRAMALDQAALGAASFGLASYATHPTSSAALLEAAEHALLGAESAGGGVQFA